jgi:hypothetical protein
MSWFFLAYIARSLRLIYYKRSIKMPSKNLFRYLLIALAMFTISQPAQAGMVTTTQMQQTAAEVGLNDILQQRDWIRAQLVRGGVEEADAVERVSAMTDAEIAQIYQRIDEVPAAGSDILILALVVFAVLEITGYIDVIPDN